MKQYIYGAEESLKSTLKYKLINGGGWALIGKISSIFLAFVINSMLARMLTPGEFGSYFLLFSLATLISLVMQLGLNQVVVRMVAESIGANNYSRAEKVVTVAIRYFFISICVGCVLMIFFGKSLFEIVGMSSDMNLIILCTSWAVLLGSQNFVSDIFRAYHNIRLSVLFGGIITSVIAVLILVFINLKHIQVELDDILIFLTASLFVNSLCAYIIVNKQKKHHMEQSQDDVSCDNILEVAWPLCVVSLTLFFLTQVDIWIISIFLSQEQVALYGAAFRLVALIVFPLLIVNVVLPPIIAELYSTGQKDKLEKLLRKITTLAGIPSLILVLIYMIFGKDILGLVYGEYYKSGYLILVLISIGQIVNVLTGSCGMVLIMTGHQKVMMFITVACSLLVILGMVLFINKYGIIAIALASTIGFSLQNITMLLVAKYKTGIWTCLGI